MGRAYLWFCSVWAGDTCSTATASRVSDSGGAQFFPAIAADGNGGAFVSFSQTNPLQATSADNSYDTWLAHVVPASSTTVTKVSTASSKPNKDFFFSGGFIGDYHGMTVLGGTAHPLWTDLRSADPNYPGYEMDAMVYSP